MAAEEGFEPSHTESESAVLPLHHSATFILLFYQIAPRVSRAFILVIKHFFLIEDDKWHNIVF